MIRSFEPGDKRFNNRINFKLKKRSFAEDQDEVITYPKQFLLLEEKEFPSLFKAPMIARESRILGKDNVSEDDYESDEGRVKNGQKKLVSSFEKAIKDFKECGKTRLMIENLHNRTFPAE